MTYRVTFKGGNIIIDKMTSNTSVLLSGLDQLTRYKVKVQAMEKTGGVLLASAVVVFNTLGEFYYNGCCFVLKQTPPTSF